MRTIREHAASLVASAAMLSVLLPGVASAQEDGGERQPGEPYVAEVFTDWEIRCITAAEEGQAERCEMFQLLLDEDDNPVAVFRLNVPFNAPEGQVAVAIFVTPLETLLTPGLRLRIDDGDAAAIAFTLCEPSGCLARVPLSQENVDLFKAGGDAFLELFALVRSDLGEIGGVPVALSASLRGFTAAYDSMQERHTAFAELVAELQAAAAAEAGAEGGAEAGDQ